MFNNILNNDFAADQLARSFDLDEERYVPVMIISIGKARPAAI